MQSQPHPRDAVLRQVVIDLAIMSAIGVVLALLGPFGTFAQPLAHRLIYWVGLALTGYACFRPLGSVVLRMGARLTLPKWGLWLAASLIASAPMAAIVTALSFLDAPLRLPSLETVLLTYFSVLLIGGGVTILFHLLEQRRAEAIHAPLPGAILPSLPSGTQPPSVRFVDRLPPQLGSQLIALEMEDHYVRAYTLLGSDLVLMRMRDAVAELDGIEGLQVHRSWWVARDAVEEVRRDGRNVRLALSGGIEAPVSRANLPLLKECGWI